MEQQLDTHHEAHRDDGAAIQRERTEVRRGYWNEPRQSSDPQAAKRFKDGRWSLPYSKAPERLTDKQAATLARLKAAGGELARVHAQGCHATRAIFAPGLTVADVEILIDRLR